MCSVASSHVWLSVATCYCFAQPRTWLLFPRIALLLCRISRHFQRRSSLPTPPPSHPMFSSSIQSPSLLCCYPLMSRHMLHSPTMYMAAVHSLSYFPFLFYKTNKLRQMYFWFVHFLQPPRASYISPHQVYRGGGGEDGAVNRNTASPPQGSKLSSGRYLHFSNVISFGRVKVYSLCERLSCLPAPCNLIV